MTPRNLLRLLLALALLVPTGALRAAPCATACCAAECGATDATSVMQAGCGCCAPVETPAPRPATPPVIDVAPSPVVVVAIHPMRALSSVVARSNVRAVPAPRLLHCVRLL